MTKISELFLSHTYLTLGKKYELFIIQLQKGVYK